MGAQLLAFDDDPAIGAIVLTGNEQAFAAGADIKEMKDRTHPAAVLDDFIGRRWETVLRVKKPVIAAVAGFALGGGCELAMMCDFILAADTAQVRPAGDQPGRAAGRRRHAAADPRGGQVEGDGHDPDRADDGRGRGRARQPGVARVPGRSTACPEALKIAARIAELSPVAVAFAKQAVNRAFETTLVEGVRHERALFMSLFGTHDQREGMAAFAEKRKPAFRLG